MTDLRPTLELPTDTIEQSLATKGFAVMRHHSDLLDSIPSEEGTSKYLEQCCEWVCFRILKERQLMLILKGTEEGDWMFEGRSLEFCLSAE